jgi:hypothetical protein
VAIPKQLIGTLSPDMNTRAGRMLAGGDLTMTVTSQQSNEHITLRFRATGDYASRWERRMLLEADFLFAKVGDHRVGKYRPGTGWFIPYDDADPKAVWAAIAALKAACGEFHPQARFQEAANCGWCGAELTDPISIDRGYGPHCYGRITGSKHMRIAAGMEG